MASWEDLYEAAKGLYDPHEVSPFIYSNHVVAAVEAEDGRIYTGVCFEATSGVLHLCAERMALVNMYMDSRQTKIKKVIAFRDKAPYGGSSGMPCGACREFMMQLNMDNRETLIMQDYATKQTVKLGDLIPEWWGEERLNMDLDL